MEPLAPTRGISGASLPPSGGFLDHFPTSLARSSSERELGAASVHRSQIDNLTDHIGPLSPGFRPLGDAEGRVLINPLSVSADDLQPCHTIWQQRTNVWRRLTSPARVDKATKKRSFGPAMQIRGHVHGKRREGLERWTTQNSPTPLNGTPRCAGSKSCSQSAERTTKFFRRHIQRNGVGRDRGTSSSGGA